MRIGWPACEKSFILGNLDIGHWSLDGLHVRRVTIWGIWTLDIGHWISGVLNTRNLDLTLDGLHGRVTIWGFKGKTWNLEEGHHQNIMHIVDLGKRDLIQATCSLATLWCSLGERVGALDCQW